MLISVIITTYNAELFINRTLDSIFSQTGFGIEFQLQVIVVDDKSIDNTKNIIKKYDVEFYENEQNSGGPNKGRNFALQKSKGDYITFIDHDDEWLPNKISTQLKYITNEKVITGGYIDIDIKNNKKRYFVNSSHEKFIRYAENETFIAKLERNKNEQIAYMASIMVHKDLKNLFFEQQYGMSDYDWILKIFNNNSSLEICEPVFVRYVDGKNLSFNEKYRLNNYQNAHNALLFYSNEYKKEAQLGIKKLNGTMARYYYVVGNVFESRKYFLKSDLSIVNILYYITTFIGRKWVIKTFKVFG